MFSSGLHNELPFPNCYVMKYLLHILSLTLLLGCERKDIFPKSQSPTTPLSLLPPETQIGWRSFGCLVNGQAWTPAGNPFGGPVLTCGYIDQRLVISASRSATVNGISSLQRISIVLKKVSQAGRYSLNDSSRFAEYENFNTGCTLSTSIQQAGTVELTKLDPVARIASGRFSFTLESAGCGQFIVTDGRFDCPF